MSSKPVLLCIGDSHVNMWTNDHLSADNEVKDNIISIPTEGATSFGLWRESKSAGTGVEGVVALFKQVNLVERFAPGPSDVICFMFG